MGEKPAVIAGDFANYKPILGRKVLALVVEVPIERAGEVFAALGYPTGGGSIPVAIARLNGTPEPKSEPKEEAPPLAFKGLYVEGVEGRDESDLTSQQPQQEKAEKPKRSRAIRQAGIVCKEPEFWAFLSKRMPGEHVDEIMAARYVRAWCDVRSRADIEPGSEAERKWNRLFLEYGIWQQRQARRR